MIPLPLTTLLTTLLLACPDQNDSGADPELCEQKGGGRPMMLLDSELGSACTRDLQGSWARNDALWDQGTFTTNSTNPAQASTQLAAESILTALSQEAGSDTVARQEVALLASGLLAQLYGLDTMESACDEFGGWATCALEIYTGQQCTPSGPPPPPHGNEPEAFCNTILNFPESAFNCYASPLSQALSFAALDTGIQTTANLWLTVTTKANTTVDRIWWPVWLAAYGLDAPSMLLFTATDTNGNPVAGVLVVHHIQLSVRGPGSDVQAFWDYVDAIRVGDTGTAPTWSKLRIALPSTMRYQVVTEVSSAAPTSTAVQTWTPGGNLVLPGGAQVPWKFTSLVGIIDPCRVPDRERPAPDYCSLRAKSWTQLVDVLEPEGMDGVFNIEDICE